MDGFMQVLDWIMQPIYWAISGILVGFHWLFSQVMDPNSGWTWALAIISLTIVIRTLMIPLFVKQINSSRKMQVLGPKVKALQEKYGHNRELLGQKTMEMYKEEGVNPAASCLPLIVQMPIFIGLFTVLNNAARMGAATGYWFQQNPELVKSLQHAKLLGAEVSGTFLPFTTFGATQGVAAFLIIAMTVTLFITQLQLMRKNMPPESLEGPMAQQQKMMLYLFPVIYLVTGVSIPIGVMIYWLASNIWTLAQQYILIHNNPTPNTPAFIDWQDRMRAKGKDPDEIIRRRTQSTRKPRATVSDDPTKVARQGSSRVTSTPKDEADATASDGTNPSQVRRQQPRQQPRAKRKQARPRTDGERPGSGSQPKE